MRGPDRSRRSGRRSRNARAPGPRELLAERTAALEDHGSPDVAEADHVGEEMCEPLRPGEAQQHPVGAAGVDPITDEAILGFVDGAVDVTHSRAGERGKCLGSLDRGFDQALTVPSRPRKPTL